MQIFPENDYETNTEMDIALSILYPYELLCPQSPTLPAVQLWPYIKVKVKRFSRLTLIATLIKINDVLHGRTTSIDDPIVSVKGRLVSKPCVEAGTGREGSSGTAEREKTGATASELHQISKKEKKKKGICKQHNRENTYFSAPFPLSHSRISFHALSLTALWIGTMARMSSALGS